MGMESYNIMLLPENVQIIYIKDLWHLEGSSGLSMDEVNRILKDMCRRRPKNWRDDTWILEECIDILVYTEDTQFQGFELRGCLAYFEEGLKLCYQFYESWNRRCPLTLYVMNQAKKVSSYQDFHDVVLEEYSAKLEWFRNNYSLIMGEKVTTGNYQKLYHKKNRWYYKLYRKLRR